MTRKSYLHSPTAPSPVQANIVISVKRLLITEKSTAVCVVGAECGSSLYNPFVRAIPMTDTLRKFEGYSHHGINE